MGWGVGWRDKVGRGGRLLAGACIGLGSVDSGLGLD